MFSNPNIRRILVPAVAVGVAFLPILVSFFRQQWQRPEYQAFPLLLISVGYFLFTRMGTATPVNRVSMWVTGLSWLAALVAWVFLAASMYVFSPWLAMVAFVVFCFSVTCGLMQNWRIRGLWALWALLILLVPPPLDRDQLLIERLQLFSSKVTSLLMDAFGVLHVMQGNTLILPDKQLFVDEACSGIVSLISILYCIAIYCVWRERGVVQAVLLLIAGVLWTIMMNSLRLTTIGLAWAWYKVDLAVGAPHSLLAVVLFGISILVIYALDRFLAEVLAPVDSEWRTQDREDAHPGLTLMQIWDRFFSTREDELAEEDDEATDEAEGLRVNRETLAQEQAASVARFSAPWSTFGIPVTTGFAALGLVYLSVFGVQETKYQGVVDRALDRALELSGTFVVDNQMGLEFKEFSSDRREIFRWDDWGQHSRTYSYADAEGAVYQVSCDFMFGPHWHDLRICYRGAGWKIRNESILRLGDLASSDREPLEVISSLTAPPLVEQFFIEREGEQQKGMITYGAFRASGEWFNRPRGAGLYNDMWAHIVQGRDRAEQADYFQVQVTTFFEGELSAEQKARAERLLKIAVERFKEGIGVEAKEEGNRG